MGTLLSPVCQCVLSPRWAGFEMDDPVSNHFENGKVPDTLIEAGSLRCWLACGLKLLVDDECWWWVLMMMSVDDDEYDECWWWWVSPTPFIEAATFGPSIEIRCVCVCRRQAKKKQKKYKSRICKNSQSPDFIKTH